MQKIALHITHTVLHARKIFTRNFTCRSDKCRNGEHGLIESFVENNHLQMRTVAEMHTLGLIDDVDISKIKLSKISIREETGDLGQLILSIKEKGLLHPIIIRIMEDKFEIVAGHRRFLACKSIGWRKIPCHVVDLTDDESFEVSLIENIQRKTMNPIEEARAYERYIKDHGWGGESELAKRIGKSQEYVSKRMKLLELPKGIQEEIIRRRIKPSMAEELSYIKNEKEQSQLAKLIVQRHVTIKKLRDSLKGESIAKKEDDYTISYAQENNHEDKIFDKVTIALKLVVKRMNELLEMAEENFVIYEFLLYQQKTINEQIDHTLRSKKKYSKLFS